MNTSTRRLTLALVVIIIVSAIIFLSSRQSRIGSGGVDAVSVVPARSATSSTDVAVSSTTTTTTGYTFLTPAQKAQQFSLAKEITDPTGFINTGGKPVTISSLVGKKVILIDFWTYSCINCQRTIPYLNSWYSKYAKYGLEIIGVHSPEFDFEKDINNVTKAVTRFGIEYPVVLDSNYGTWKAYDNQYWPHEYLIDIDGYVVHDQIGEGNYQETEQEIQKALVERAVVLGLPTTGIAQPLTTDVSQTPSGPMSPETYFGSARNEFFGNGMQSLAGLQAGLVIPQTINPDTFYLSGDWNFFDQYAQNKSANAQIEYQYTATNVFFVAGANTDTTVEILRDGKPLGVEKGSDVVTTTDGKTVVHIKDNRLYNIIQDSSTGTHTLQFIIETPGLQAYTFTFG